MVCGRVNLTNALIHSAVVRARCFSSTAEDGEGNAASDADAAEEATRTPERRRGLEREEEGKAGRWNCVLAVVGGIPLRFGEGRWRRLQVILPGPPPRRVTFIFDLDAHRE